MTNDEARAGEPRARTRKPPLTDEVREEMAHHLEMLERDLISQGLSPDEARAKAGELFGDTDRVGKAMRSEGAHRDDVRRRADWLRELRQDVRHALRQLRAHPRFAVVAILTLAIGLGAATTIFGLADVLLLRPLPYPASDRLTITLERTPSGDPFAVSEPNYLDWRERSTRFAATGAFSMITPSLTSGEAPLQLQGARVTWTMFDVLGVRPRIGRAFTAPEDAAGAAAPVAIIGDALWRTRFGADSAILGQAIELDGVRHLVAGVMPPGFDFPLQTEIWLPLGPSTAFPRGDRRLEGMVGRLAPDASIESASSELAAIATRLASEHPASNADWGVEVQPLRQWYVGPELRSRVLVLLGAVGLLLAMSCVNVASLLLARAGARAREIAVRASLGAGRGRLVRQLLTESLVLALIGGAAAVGVAALAVPVLRGTGLAALPALESLRLDWRILGFALAACLATGAAFGVIPALRLARGGVSGGGLRGAMGGGMRIAEGAGIRNGLIVASVALAMLMLVGASLVGSSFMRLMRVDLGFSAERVLTGTIALPDDRYDPERVIGFYRALEERLAALPGVQSAGLTNLAPFTAGNTAMGYAPAGREPATRAEYPTASWRMVNAEYFDAMRIPLTRGRVFEPGDGVDAPRRVLINGTLARRAFPDQNPLGRQLALGNGGRYEIIGVVGDTRPTRIEEEPAPQIYFSTRQFPWPVVWLALRTSGDPLAMAAAVQREVQAIDPLLPVAEVQPMTALVREVAAAPRLTVLIFAIFATAAAVLAAIGLYGLVSYSVAQRTREIGVRVALGATPKRVIGGVLGHGMRLTAAGVVLGTAAALAAGRAMQSVLYDTDPHDPRTMIAVAVLLGLVALLACALPARRAARLDPVEALRSDA